MKEIPQAIDVKEILQVNIRDIQFAVATPDDEEELSECDLQQYYESMETSTEIVK